MTECEIIELLTLLLVFLVGALVGFVVGFPKHHVIKWKDACESLPKENGFYLCVIADYFESHSIYYQQYVECDALGFKGDLNIKFWAEAPPFPHKVDEWVLKGIGHYCKNLKQ